MVSEAQRVPRRSSGLPAALGRVGKGVLRPADAAEVYARPSQEFARLVERGVLHKVATGYYVVVPLAARDRTWRPTLEAVAYGIAAADYGADGSILMGRSAARLHGVIPRALGVAVVAVDRDRPTIALADREATVVFVRRDTARLDAERVSTDLGSALATSVEQTVLDLARRPTLGGSPADAQEIVRALWPRADEQRLQALAQQQRMRATLRRARAWAGG